MWNVDIFVDEHKKENEMLKTKRENCIGMKGWKVKVTFKRDKKVWEEKWIGLVYMEKDMHV